MEQVKVMDTNTKNRKFMTIGTIIREQKSYCESSIK
jgi:hypothetical protein